jgi:glutamate synthase (NADPH/NADH) small chain
VGGFLRFGVPDFKLDKSIIDRRVNILQEEGLIIKTGVKVGTDISSEEIKSTFDAVCMAVGARKPRDLLVEGRELDGIHQAMDYLEQQNRMDGGDALAGQDRITAARKHVVVMGGGDTGSDCVGTAIRQGAKSVTQLEILPAPPRSRPDYQPWPLWPKIYKTSSSHAEGCERLFGVSTRRFIGESGHLTQLCVVRVDWDTDENGRYRMTERPGSEFELEADLVILALGFEHAVHEGLVHDLGVQGTGRGDIAVDGRHMTNVAGIFAAGDAAQGASLLVRAIFDGRTTAKDIDAYLKGI